MRDRVILSLCDHTGNWCRPYREAGYTVIQWDLADEQDVRLMPWPGKVHGILAAPPCTVFCRLGSTKKRTDDEMREGLSVVDACLRYVATCNPTWWALENPPGKLSRWLGPETWKFQPCDYGQPWTKLTYLWGRFTEPSWNIPGTPRPVLPTVENRTVNTSDPVERAATPD